MRKKWIVSLLFLLSVTGLAAQEEAGDTTIYRVVEEQPRFPACERLDTTLEAKSQCAQQQLLAFVYQNIVYPMEARQNGNEGQVVVSFVVEKDGMLSNPTILKDIGGGCGLEVVRVVELMNQAAVRWVPGRIGGKVVRSVFNLPVRFRLEEAPPYTLIEGDTVYTKLDEPLTFKGGEEALIEYLTEALDYPPSGNDSCLIGNIDVQIQVGPNGVVRILSLTDFANLGFDFWYEATDAATSTIGKWNPAVYQGRPVPAAYDLSMYFQPTAATCQRVVENYQSAIQLANDGQQLISEEKTEEGLAKLSQAIELFPDNATFLFMRGQAYLDLNRLPEACTDLNKAQSIALNDWYSGVLPIICR